MTIDGELAAIRAVARQLNTATRPPDARRQRAWAAALTNSARGIANGVLHLRAELSGQRRSVEVGDPAPYEGLDPRQAAEVFAERLLTAFEVGAEPGSRLAREVGAEADALAAAIAASAPRKAGCHRPAIETRPDTDSAGAARSDGGRTMKAAALAAEPRTGGQRRRVLDAIAAVARDPRAVGLTDVEVQRATGLSPNSERPRRVELVAGGWIEDSGETREHHGREHVVWVLTEKAARWLAGQRTEAAAS